MPYLNIPNSKLAPSISTIVGKIEGKLSSSIDNTASNIERDLKKGIPKNISNLDRRIGKNLQQLQIVKTRLSKIKGLTAPLRRASINLLRLVTILKALPIPGFSLTAGITTTFSDTLHLVKEFSHQLKEDSDGIDSIISDRDGTEFIDFLESKLLRLKTLTALAGKFDSISETVDPKDKESFENTLSRAATKEDITSEVTRLQSTLLKYGQEVEVQDNIIQDTSGDIQEVFIGPDGREYSLSIISLSSDFTLSPQRQAIARETNTGQVLFTSSPSFASNPDILIEELKFKITTSL